MWSAPARGRARKPGRTNNAWVQGAPASEARWDPSHRSPCGAGCPATHPTERPSIFQADKPNGCDPRCCGRGMCKRKVPAGRACAVVADGTASRLPPCPRRGPDPGRPPFDRARPECFPPRRGGGRCRRDAPQCRRRSSGKGRMHSGRCRATPIIAPSVDQGDTSRRRPTGRRIARAPRRRQDFAAIPAIVAESPAPRCRGCDRRRASQRTGAWRHHRNRRESAARDGDGFAQKNIERRDGARPRAHA